jgi:integrase
MYCGGKTIHLPPPALAVLAEVCQLDGNPYVIVGAKPGAAFVNLEKPWRAIRGAAALDDVRLHDLRHAFASIAASSGLANHRQDARSQPAGYDGALRTSCQRSGNNRCCCRRQ